MFGIEAAAKSPVQNHDPEKQSDGKKNLPDAAQVEIFKALIAEPGAVDQSLNAGKLSQQASDYDNNQCAQQAIRKRLLPSRLASGRSSAQGRCLRQG